MLDPTHLDVKQAGPAALLGAPPHAPAFANLQDAPSWIPGGYGVGGPLVAAPAERA
jgi:hypothetical protein